MQDSALIDAVVAAIRAGESVRATTSPNPPVGCVLIDATGTPIASGATSPAGGPHAEVGALARAGERARGATAVVTLEPCNHTGRTGPCTKALLRAGVARVVYLTEDPSPAAGGRRGVLALARRRGRVPSGARRRAAAVAAIRSAGQAERDLEVRGHPRRVHRRS